MDLGPGLKGLESGIFGKRRKRESIPTNPTIRPRKRVSLASERLKGERIDNKKTKGPGKSTKRVFGEVREERKKLCPSS